MSKVEPHVKQAYDNLVKRPLLREERKRSSMFSFAEPVEQPIYIEQPEGLGRSASYSMPHQSQQSSYMASSPMRLQPINKKNQFFKLNQNSILHPHRLVDPAEEQKEKQLLNSMEHVAEIEKVDQYPNKLVEKESIRHFYTNYKQVERIAEQNDFYKINNSAQTAMLRKSSMHDLLPCKIGLVKPKGQEQQLKITHGGYGDNYASVLSEGLKSAPNVKEFLIGNNRIKPVGASLILNSIGRNARVIDLQQNTIGVIGTETICAQIQAKDNKLEVLNLEDNKLGDRNALKIIKAFLNSNNKLKSLNLSKNFLTNDICEPVANLIRSNDNLEELYLHWNQIKAYGGQKIFEALLDNAFMLVLDLSWNSLGIVEKKDCVCLQKICEFLQYNRTLLHFDLSANYFSLQDSIQIAEALKKNRTIYGFHFMGNWGVVNERQFLIIKEDEIQKVLGDTPRIHGLDQTIYTRHEDVCWICEGWQEHQFEWTSKSGEGDPDPLFVHMGFEGHKQVYIPKVQDTCALSFMVPPNKHTYFYTLIDTPVAAQDQEQQPYGRVVYSNQVLDNMNILHKPKHYSLFDQDFKAKTTVLPRTPDPIYIPPKLKKQKRIWSFPISIWFKDFKFENEDLLKKCFEKDWSCCKISKIVKNPDELEQIKGILWQNYRLLKETYKYYASYNPTGDVWSITTNVITEFAQQSEIIDNKTLKLSDLDLKFIATCASSIEYKGNPRNPERALCRFQFLEFLVRVSEDKYLKTKLAANMVESTRMLMDQARGWMSQFDQQKWRDERYFNEQCDDCCKHFKPLLTFIYNRFSAKKVKPGQKKFMCLDELQDICSEAGLFQENFVDRDANMAFNLSMLLQVDELEQDRIFQMTFVEFLEALARIAEKVSYQSLMAEDDLTWEQRQQQPLHFKLERLFIQLANTLASEDLKTQFALKKSIFDIVEDE